MTVSIKQTLLLAQLERAEERLHRSTIAITIIIKSVYHKGITIIEYFMVTVENVSPTGATMTITFMARAVNGGIGQNRKHPPQTKLIVKLHRIDAFTSADA